MINDFKFKHSSYILTVLSLLLLYWPIFIPGVKGAHDLPYSDPSYLKTLLNFPQAWSDISSPFGANVISTLWSYPYNLILGIFANFGMDYAQVVLITGFIPLILIGTFSIRKWAKFLNLSPIASYAAVLVYLTNSYIALLIDGGQILWAMAYAYLPFSIYLLEEGITDGFVLSYKRIFLISILGFFDIRAIYLLAIVFFIRFIFQFWKIKNFKDLKIWITYWVKLVLYLAVTLILLNFYWLYPLFQNLSSTIPVGFIASSNLDFVQFTSFAHALLISQPHWFENDFGHVTGVKFEFIILPFFAFLAPVLKIKNFYIGFLFILVFLGLILTKGTNPPFGQLFRALYDFVPGFFIFRDTSKFYIFLTFPFSLLFAFSLMKIQTKLKSKIFSILVLTFLIFLIKPVYLGQMTGLLGLPFQTLEYKLLGKVIKEDSKLGRVLYVPYKGPLGYIDPENMPIDAVDLSKIRPFATGIKGTYETINYLREASYSGELLEVFGIKYLAFPPLDMRKKYKKDQIIYHDLFIDQISGQKYIQELMPKSPIPLFKLKDTQSLIFSSSNTYFVIGDDSIYDKITAKNQKLSDGSFIFAEEQPGALEKINVLPYALILLNKKNETDLATNFLTPEKMIFPAANLLKDQVSSSSWWKRNSEDFLSWKEFLKDKYGIINQDFDYGGGWAVGENYADLNIHLPDGSDGKILLARVLESTRSGSLKISSSDQIISYLETKNTGDNFHWHEVGVIPQGAKSIKIESFGAINVLNALQVTSEADWIKAKVKVEKLKNQTRILDQIKTGVEIKKAQINFIKLSSTKYQVWIRGLNHPQMLIFSNRFDQNWRLNKTDPIKVFSFLNGFPIFADGEYVLEYLPQRNVEKGLWVSLTFLLLALFTIYKNHLKV